jgi:hypothetical protein
MHTLPLATFIGIFYLSVASSFLTAPVSTVLNYNRSNITCSQQVDTLYNGTITSTNNTDPPPPYYCAISVVTYLLHNLTQTVITRFSIFYWNIYHNIAINNCGFSTTMDIGYGNCTPYYVDTATSIQFCICSTDRCSDTYSTCQTSVNQALSSPPPLLPVLQPTLSNTITCQDYSVNISAIYNYTPPMYLGCGFLFYTLGTPDLSKCYSYTPNHTIICSVFYDPIDGSSNRAALIEGASELFMAETIEMGVASTNISSGYYQYQTSTSIASIYPSNSGPYNIVLCLCITNNCNADFATCTQGMNIPLYLLSYNGSTALTSIVSTSSISSNTTSSFGSTTRPLSSTSSTIISSLLSSAATSVTPSITSAAVGNRNTSSSAATYPSFADKLFPKLNIILLYLSFY